MALVEPVVAVVVALPLAFDRSLPVDAEVGTLVVAGLAGVPPDGAFEDDGFALAVLVDPDAVEPVVPDAVEPRAPADPDADPVAFFAPPLVVAPEVPEVEPEPAPFDAVPVDAVSLDAVAPLVEAAAVPVLVWVETVCDETEPAAPELPEAAGPLVEPPPDVALADDGAPAGVEAAVAPAGAVAVSGGLTAGAAVALPLPASFAAAPLVVVVVRLVLDPVVFEVELLSALPSIVTPGLPRLECLVCFAIGPLACDLAACASRPGTPQYRL